MFIVISGITVWTVKSVKCYGSLLMFIFSWHCILCHTNLMGYCMNYVYGAEVKYVLKIIIVKWHAKSNEIKLFKNINDLYQG